MSDIDGSARGENGEIFGVIEASDVFRAEMDLEPNNMSIQAGLANNQTGDLPWHQ